MEDIFFYDLELNRLHTLAPSGSKSGYIMVNTRQEFRGDGSAQINFWSDDLCNIIRAHPEGVIFRIGKFEGVITDYNFKKDEKTLYGAHLNALLRKAVIPTQTITDKDPETELYKIVTAKIPWLSTAEVKGGFDKLTYTSDTYMRGNEFFADVAQNAKIGYRVYADFVQKKYFFELLASDENSLMMSESNLNIYEIEEDYVGTSAAFGGWYQKEQKDSNGNATDPVWTYIKSEEKEGIYVTDTVLSATTEDEAKKELAGYAAEKTVSTKTRNIVYGKDYRLGDKLRMQQNGDCTIKLVNAIEMWWESGHYSEEPELTDTELKQD